jgi:hypothetical protein
VGAGKFFGESIDVVEVPVRFILVLLLKLGIVEFFVIEFAMLRWVGRLDISRKGNWGC